VASVRLLETSGTNGRDIEKDLGISSGQIHRWCKQLVMEAAGIRAFTGTGNPWDEELVRLKREAKEPRGVRDILRKAVAMFSRSQR
jgi:transposase-like protein